MRLSSFPARRNHSGLARPQSQASLSLMGYEAKKTEHCGAKHGNGAYWGYRWDAKN